MKVWQPTDYYDVATEFTRISTCIFNICVKLGIYDSLDKHTCSTCVCVIATLLTLLKPTVAFVT